MTKHATMSRIFALPLSPDPSWLGGLSDKHSSIPIKVTGGIEDMEGMASAVARAVNCHDRLVKALEGAIHEAGARGGEDDYLLHPEQQPAAVQEAMAAHEEAAGWHIPTLSERINRPPPQPAADAPAALLTPGIPQPGEGYLCIGGPYDGRRVATFRGHPRFKVAVCHVPEYEHDAMSVEKVDFEPLPPRDIVEYVLQHIGFSAPSFAIWVPRGQTEGETAAMLTSGYKAKR